MKTMQNQEILFRFQTILRTFPCMLVTESSLCQNEDHFLTRLNNACQAGIHLIQFREKLKPLSPSNKLTLANQVRLITQKHNSLLLINTDVSLALAVKADGIHFPDTAIRELNHFLLSDTSKSMISGKSIHSTEPILNHTPPRSLTQPLNNLDYILFGHVFQTPSKPNSPQGIEKLRACVEVNPLPVFAIGGMTHENICLCLKAGAKGFALMSPILQQRNYINIIQQLKMAYSNCSHASIGIV